MTHCGRPLVSIGFVAAFLALLLAQPDARPRPLGLATGLWTGEMTVAGTTRTYTFQLHERANRRLLGYLLGGTSSRTILDGTRDGTAVKVAFEFDSPAGRRTPTLVAELRGDALVGSIHDGAASARVHLRRLEGPFVERRFLFARPGPEGVTDLTEVAVTLDSRDRLINGGVTALSSCGLWGCSSGVTSFADAAGSLTMHLDGGVDCAAGFSVTATFDEAAKTYSGRYSCGGADIGPFVGGRTSRTRSVDVAGVLGALARVADGFDTATTFAAPHASFSTTYLDSGETLADVFSDFNGELAAYSAIHANVNRIGLVNTVSDPAAFPGLVMPLGAEFEETRSGVPVAGGARVTYVDTRRTPRRPRFRVWTVEAGAWVISGNGGPALKLPFRDYTLHDSPGVPASVEIRDGATPLVYARPAPFGAHMTPLTGHAFGNAKGDWVGFFTRDDGDLVECTGDGDPLREPGEVWGFAGGAGGASIRSRIPTYVAPRDATVVSLSRVAMPAGSPYFDGVPHWRLELLFGTGERLELDHIGRIVTGLRNKIYEATGHSIDTDVPESAGTGTDLLAGATIAVLEDEALAQPQVFASESATAGCYTGGGTYPDRPWAQMEWRLTSPSGPRATDICFYDHLDRATRGALQAIVEAQMNDATHQGYRPFAAERWRWSAEARLCMAYSGRPKDFSALYTDLGGWFEVEGASPSDEIVAFAPMARETAAFRPGLYVSPSTDTLVLRRRDNRLPRPSFEWRLPTGPRTVFYPVGEILERTADTLLIYWRDEGLEANAPAFQRVAYLLDANGLKIRWSPVFAGSPAAATVEPITASTPCDGAEVVCYNHAARPGY